MSNSFVKIAEGETTTARLDSNNIHDIDYLQRHSANMDFVQQYNNFKSNPKEWSSLGLNGYVRNQDKHYYVRTIDNNAYEQVKKDKEARNMLYTDQANSTDDIELRTAIKEVRAGNLQEGIANCSANSPSSMGGLEFTLPSTLKFLGDRFEVKATYGTMAVSRGERKRYTLDDYITPKIRADLGYTPYAGYILERPSQQFTSWREIKNAFTALPGAQNPSNIERQNAYSFDAKMLNTKAYTQLLQYNLYSMTAMQGYYGIDQIAYQMSIIEQGWQRLYHYSGLSELYNNKTFKVSKLSLVNGSPDADNDFVKFIGMVNTDGTAKFTMDNILYKDVATIQQFVTGMRNYIQMAYGNMTMEKPVLVLPNSVNSTWETISYATTANLNILQGYRNFKEYFEVNTGIEVLPMNEIDKMARGLLSESADEGLSLLNGDNAPNEDHPDVFMFYDKDQFRRITTKPFTQFNGVYGTGNGYQMSTLYDGVITDVYNIFEDKNIDTYKVPANIVKIYPDTIPA